MKTNILIIAAIALTLGFSTCQNNASKTETDHSSMDNNNMDMGSMSMNSGMQSGMDKMMTDMHQMEMTGNIDNDFAMMMDMHKMEGNSSTDKQYTLMMIPHHQSAVKMAEGFVQFGKDSGLISMAKKMIADQKMEIEQFKKWSE